MLWKESYGNAHSKTSIVVEYAIGVKRQIRICRAPSGHTYRSNETEYSENMGPEARFVGEKRKIIVLMNVRGFWIAQHTFLRTMIMLCLGGIFSNQTWRA